MDMPRRYLPFVLAIVRRALVETITVCMRPLIIMRRRWRFGFHARLVSLNENEREWPKLVFLPVNAHFAMGFNAPVCS